MHPPAGARLAKSKLDKLTSEELFRHQRSEAINSQTKITVHPLPLRLEYTKSRCTQWSTCLRSRNRKYCNQSVLSWHWTLYWIFCVQTEHPSHNICVLVLDVDNLDRDNTQFLVNLILFYPMGCHIFHLDLRLIHMWLAITTETTESHDDPTKSSTFASRLASSSRTISWTFETVSNKIDTFPPNLQYSGFFSLLYCTNENWLSTATHYILQSRSDLHPLCAHA